MIVSCRYDYNVIFMTRIYRHQLFITGLTQCRDCISSFVRDIDNDTCKTQCGRGIRASSREHATDFPLFGCQPDIVNKAHAHAVLVGLLVPSAAETLEEIVSFAEFEIRLELDQCAIRACLVTPFSRQIGRVKRRG